MIIACKIDLCFSVSTYGYSISSVLFCQTLPLLSTILKCFKLM